jgi:hypothetical protein
MTTAVMTRNRYVAAFVATAVATAAVMLLWLPLGAQEPAPGFDGYIQSGTCEAPETEDPVFIELEDARQDYAVEPYLAKVSGEDATITLAYYGAALAPGFGFSTMFADQEVFSLVIIDPESRNPVACGDLFQPDDENFEQIGVALIRLEPVGDSGLQGFASIERTETERELDIISTRVRILLMTEPVSVAPPAGTPVASPVASPEASA